MSKTTPQPPTKTWTELTPEERTTAGEQMCEALLPVLKQQKKKSLSDEELKELIKGCAAVKAIYEKVSKSCVSPCPTPFFSPPPNLHLAPP